VSLASAQTPVGEPLTTDQLAELYADQFSYVWHALRRLGIPFRDLPDVTHDVFVAVYRGYERYDRTRPLRPWLFGVCFGVASDHRRLARHAREVSVDEIMAADHAPGVDEQVEDKRNRARAQAALLRLDFEQRAVLVAHDFDELTGQDIASLLGIPLKRVYYRLKIAREAFISAVRRANMVRSPV
jgi:RNA polymerase sigma-70 factor, ECF subfamily